MEAEGRTKTLSARGAELKYDIRGDGTPSVVFVHGWGCRRSYFRELMDSLGGPGTFVAIDLPGHGDSTAGSGPWTMERFGQDVVDVIEAEGLSDVVLVAHSMGAAVALETARLARSKIKSVVALDGLSHLSIYRAQPDEAVEPLMAAMRADQSGTVTAMMGGLFSAAPKDGLKERLLSEMSATDPGCGIPALESLLRWDMDAALAATDVPVTILAARNIMPVEAPAHFANRCDLRQLDLEGHFFCIEQPKETAEELRPIIGG